VRRFPPELKGFLSSYDPAIVRSLRSTRALVLRAAPQANELIYDAYNAVSVAYSFSGRLREAFCHVAAYESHVNLGFNRGSELPDPDGLLQGSGARIRHVRIRSDTDLRTPALLALVDSAAAQGRSLVDSLPEKPAAIVQATSGKKRRQR